MFYPGAAEVASVLEKGSGCRTAKDWQEAVKLLECIEEGNRHLVEERDLIDLLASWCQADMDVRSTSPV